MAKFKFTGDSMTIFPGLQRPDGTTVEVKPGEEFEIGDTLTEAALLHPDLEPADDLATKLVTVVKEKARIDAARVFAPPAEVPIPRDPLIEDVAAAPAKAAKADPTETAPAEA